MREQKAVALITGGNRGIGLAIARQLGQQNIHVILGCRSSDKAATAVTQLRADGITADSVLLDVNNGDSRKQAIRLIQQQHQKLDILINNAGVALDKWAATSELDLDCLRATLETNVYAALHLCQLVLPSMRQRGHGRIVNISSELGSLSECQIGSSAAYRSSKTMLNMLTRLLALEEKDAPDVLINAAAPGWVRTELGGEGAPRSPEEGAKTPVWLATLPAGGPSGGFFRDEAPYPW